MTADGLVTKQNRGNRGEKNATVKQVFAFVCLLEYSTEKYSILYNGYDYVLNVKNIMQANRAGRQTGGQALTLAHTLCAIKAVKLQFKSNINGELSE